MSEKTALKHGEIRLDLIPSNWPLTPLDAKKAPYIVGWQNNPLNVSEIAEHVYGTRCKAIGLISGPVGNEPFGTVWVDVDGSSVHGLIEELSGGPFDAALPPTLAIMSGREGRVRKLYRVPKEKFDLFVRNKYIWLSDEKEKLEILWKKKQGALMGKHPDTRGYFTPDGQGFEHAENLPEIPDWLVAHIAAKNKKLGTPHLERQRYVGMNFAINTEIGLERDIRMAEKAIFALPQEHADDYDCWISAGQALHSIDDSCLDLWDRWSQLSDKYRPGMCQEKWRSFDRQGGKGLGSLIEEAKKYGFTVPMDHKAHSCDDAEVEAAAKKLAEIESTSVETVDQIYEWAEEMPVRDTPQPQIGAKKTEKVKGSKTSGVSFNQLVDFVVQFYGGNLKFCTSSQIFRKYQTSGYWKALESYEFGKDLIEALDSLVEAGVINSWTRKMLDDLKATLSEKLVHDDWYEAHEYLLFTNGLLHVPSREFKGLDGETKLFCRNLFLIHQQPYEYLEGADCLEIKKWLLWTQYDKEDRVQLLRAYMRAVLLQVNDVQKFLELVGYGKTGKSTFANLCVSLVGRDNIASTHFREMESNKFELTNFVGKKLIVLPDQDKWGGSVATLKALTGGDQLRGEVKYKANVTSFQYRGMVIITANSEIQTNDKSTGLQRRRITLYFNRVYKGRSSERKVLMDFAKDGKPTGRFAPELPGLTNWLLSMSDEDMRSYLEHTSECVADYRSESSERDRRVSPVHDWMSEHVIYDPNHWCAVGRRRKRRHDEDGRNEYADWNTDLYPSYLEHTEGMGNKPVSQSNFVSTLLEICETNELEVQKEKMERKAGFKGLRLRAPNSTAKQNEWPNIIEYINHKDKYQELYRS